MNNFKIFSSFAFALFFAACGGTEFDGELEDDTAETQDALVIPPLNSMTCNNIFTYVNNLPASAPHPYVNAGITGTRQAWCSGYIDTVTSSRIYSEETLAQLDGGDYDEECMVRFEKRFTTIGNRQQQISSRMAIGIYPTDGREPLEIGTLTPTSCTIEGIHAIVRGEVNGMQVTMSFHGTRFPE